MLFENVILFVMRGKEIISYQKFKLKSFYPDIILSITLKLLRTFEVPILWFSFKKNRSFMYFQFKDCYKKIDFEFNDF